MNIDFEILKKYSSSDEELGYRYGLALIAAIVFADSYDKIRINKPLLKSEEKRHTHHNGFDPTSEDDMNDNGMTRYMEANDDEGWD